MPVLLGSKYLSTNTAQTITGIKKFGDTSNNSSFEADGTLVFSGNATVWDDIIMPGSNLRPGGTAPAFAIFKGGIYGYRFDAGVADEIHGAFEMPHNYKEGTNLLIHVHWSPTTTDTGNIVWHFEWSKENINSVFSDPAIDSAMTPAAAPGVINQHTLSNIVSISGSGVKIGDLVAFRLYRQNGGTDTFTGNAFLHSVGVHYEIDTVGSRQTTIK